VVIPPPCPPLYPGDEIERRHSNRHAASAIRFSIIELSKNFTTVETTATSLCRSPVLASGQR
jgi:hypothetical protein